jgi:hypothetical protein
MGDDKVLQAVEPEAVAVDSGKKKHRKLKIVCFVTVVLLIIGSLLAYFVIYQNYLEKKEDEFYWQFLYAYDFRMLHVADPEIERSPEGGEFIDISRSDLIKYSRIDFVMELPPPEQRKRGVIYIAPDTSGKTQERLDYFNSMLIGTSGIEQSPEFPLTIDFLVNEHERFISDTMHRTLSDMERLPKSEWQREREILYAKVFLLQAAGEVTESGGAKSIDKDGYARHLRDYDEYPLVFAAAPPADGEAAAQTFYLYPHEDGHTDTLIANLNGIIAEQPGLLNGTGLEAPLTLEDVLNDRDELWMVIHRLDSAQMARFRTH